LLSNGIFRGFIFFSKFLEFYIGIIALKLSYIKYRMMKKILNIIIILYLSFLCNGQADSIVKLSNLHYNSEFEKNTITEYFNNQDNNYFKLFLSLSLDENIESYKEKYRRFDIIVQVLKNEKIEKKSNTKKIKLIYNYIHDNFLKK